MSFKTHLPGSGRCCGRLPSASRRPCRTTRFSAWATSSRAIYGWRGGVAEIFDALDDHLDGLSTQGLTESHRSSTPVIEIVNHIFTGLKNHPNLNEIDATCVRQWSDNFPQHSTAKHDLTGYACVVAAAWGEDEDGKQHADMLGTTAARVAEVARDAPEASVGVLLRTNRDVTAVMNLLSEMQLPASGERGQSDHRFGARVNRIVAVVIGRASGRYGVPLSCRTLAVGRTARTGR